MWRSEVKWSEVKWSEEEFFSSFAYDFLFGWMFRIVQYSFFKKECYLYYTELFNRLIFVEQWYIFLTHLFWLQTLLSRPNFTRHGCTKFNHVICHVFIQQQQNCFIIIGFTYKLTLIRPRCFFFTPTATHVFCITKNIYSRLPLKATPL